MQSCYYTARVNQLFLHIFETTLSKWLNFRILYDPAAKDATFYIGHRVEYKGTFSFGLIHQGWYITESAQVGSSWKTAAAFDNKTSEFAIESSFVVVPYTMDDPLKNCDTIGPQEPEGPEGPTPGKPPPGPPGIPGEPPPPTVQPSPPVPPTLLPGSNHYILPKLFTL